MDTPLLVGVKQQVINRDPQLFYWILIPISIVMVLTGILRHYASVLLQTTPKPQTPAAMREQRQMMHIVSLRNSFMHLTKKEFEMRREYLVAAIREGKFLKSGPDQGKDGAPPNPLSDPAAMEGMMGMMKGNMVMMIPQQLIMMWINAFFAGFVVLKLPFPLTIRFKQMLQAGVMTRDLDVRWVSSLSWYFLNLFGLQSVFIFILGNDNAASQMAQQMAMANPGAAMAQPGQDQNKMFLAEAENLEVIEHWSVYDDILERSIKRYEEKLDDHDH